MPTIKSLEKVWLPLGEASRFLSVSQSSLRQWADGGLIRCFKTAGGHRRFAREDLERLIKERTVSPNPDNLMNQTVQRLRRNLRSPKGPHSSLETVDETSRSRLRVLGRRLVALTIQYHTEKRRRAPLLEEARFIGSDYAQETLKIGLSLSQAVENFSFHRAMLIDAVRDLLPPNTSREEAVGLLRDVTDLTDKVLLALVGGYEAAHGPTAVGMAG